MNVLVRRLLASQRVVGVSAAVVAALGMAVLMSLRGHLHWGVGLGLLLDLVAAAGVVLALRMVREVEPHTLSGPPSGPPESGVPPYRGEPTAPRPGVGLPPVLTPAMIVVALGTAVLLPDVGFGLWDPWETHYGEVAREILARDDWISLWWQDEWFWSKPILLFWMSALTMGVLGVPFGPDGGAHGYHVGTPWPVAGVLAAVGAGLVWRVVRAGRAHGMRAALVSAVPLAPFAFVVRDVWVSHVRGTTLELALRLPVVLWALAALWTVTWATERIFGRRAALWSGVILLTTPFWVFLAHQAMVDMPFVAALAMAMSLLLVAWRAEADEEAPTRQVVAGGVRIELHAMQGVVFAIVAIVLPQVLYLATRHLTIGGESFLSLHADRFAAGSAGNEALRQGMPHLRMFPPILQALVAIGPAVLAIGLSFRERRLRPTLMLAFYVLSALSLMGKGLPGVGLPGLVALVALAVSGRWGLLKEIRIGSGVAIVYSVGMPWFVAMFSRHGPRFTDRLLIHDHINRLTVGVHGDTGSLQYFLAQLGYGLFPWAGLAVAGVAMLLARPSGDERRDTVHGQLLLWFVLSFALFSMMITKFHHYVFPAVPPLAMLIGVALDRLTPTDPPDGPRPWVLRAVFVLTLVVAIVVPTWCLATADDARWELLRLLPLSSTIGPGGILLVVLLAVAVAVGLRAKLAAAPSAEPGLRATGAALCVGAAAVLAMITRDLGDATAAARPKGTERLIHLFIYNYQRAWPQGFDASPVLVAFGTVGVVLLLLAASERLRRIAVAGLFVLGLSFSFWAIHGHMGPVTQHWTQQHLIRTYYQKRGSAEERLVAWQMNWKGENVYTGNRVVVYVSLDNTEVERWISRHRGQTHWFLSERGRLPNLRRILHCDERSCPIADDTSNKFVLIRARL